MESNISSATTVAYINTSATPRTIFLPSTFNIEGKFVTVKDSCNNAGSNPITIRGLGGDLFEGGISNITINQNFGFASFVAHNGIWYSLGKSAIDTSGLSGSSSNQGVSSLSSIVAYGLSTVYGGEGISSLSSIVAYGLSTVYGGEGISSLSSIVAYGLSTVSGGHGVSSLSSIVAYGLSSVSGGHGISSLSSIISYGLSSISGGHGISSLSSIVAYGLSTLERQPTPGVSSLSSIVAYGLSSISGGQGISSLSSIVAYGLSSVNGGHGVSSLSSIVSYGLSTVSGGHGVSSLSSIVAYGISSVYGGQGISSLSSIVAYGLSSVNGGQGISSLSSIVAYGLSSLWSPDGISSLSSIVTYGLSSLIQSSLTVTTVGSMNLYGRGGVGLSTIDTAPADTITNAFAKVDHWLFDNLVDQPPAPISNANTISSNTNFFTYQTFDAPFQFKSAFMQNMWLPSIFSLNVNILDSNLNNISCNITDPIYLPRGSCNLAGFYFDVRTEPADQPYFPYTFGSISNLMYININNYIPDPPINPYTIHIFYSNYSAEPVRKLTSQWFIFLGDSPNAPYNLSIDPSGTIQFTLSNSDSSRPTNIAPYSSAFINISFSNILGRYPRRYQVDSNFYNTYTSNIILNINDKSDGDIIISRINDLPPDTTLFFNTRTTNIYSINPSRLSSNSAPVITSLPDLVGNRLSVATLNGPLNYTNSGLIYSNTSLGPIIVLCNGLTEGDIYYKKWAFITFNNNTTIPIHTQSNPGSSNLGIASIQLILDNVESNIYSFDGFPNTIPNSTNTNIRTYSELTFGRISDSYNGLTTSNFYLNIQSINYYIYPNFFTAQATPHIITSILSNEYLPICNVITEIYSDTLQGLPSIANISNYKNISNDGKYGFVSGLLVLSNNVTFDLNVDVGNFAQYFYPAVNTFASVRLSYPGYLTNVSNIFSNVTIYNSNDLYGIIDIGTKAPNPARFKLSNVDFSPPTGVLLWTNGGTNRLTVNISNLTNIVGTVAGTISCNLDYYFDSLSLSNIDNNLASAKSIGGLRMEAAGVTCNTSFTLYDHRQLIVGNTNCNNYNSEIPLLGGFHTIGTSIGTYYNDINNFWPVEGFPQYNYPNYSGIGSDGLTRYATFKYSLSNSGPNFVKLLEFNFNSYDGITNTAPNNIFNSGIVPTLWYKIDNSGPYDTGWLNGNVTKNSYLAFNSASATNGAAGLRSNDIYTPIDGAKRYFSMIPIPESCNFDVYVKIGLKTQGRFDYIKIGLSNGSTPAAPTGISLSQIFNSGTTIRLEADWVNDPTSVPNISNIIIASNIVDERYPRRWTPPGTLNYSNEIIRCNTFGTATTQQFNILNPDTLYTVNVQTLNDIGYSAIGYLLSPFKTALPITFNPFYIDGSILLRDESNYKYIYSSGIAIGTRIPATNIINYKLAMMGNSLIYQLNSNTPITFNYEDNEVGSNLSKMVLYVRGNSQSRISISEYAFDNSLYSNTDITNVIGSNSTDINNTDINLKLTNLGDRWSGSASGFYYKGSVSFIVSSNFAVASNYEYTFTLYNINNETLAATNTLYLDNFTEGISPDISQVYVDTNGIDNTYYSYVSGILVFDRTKLYNLWIKANNLGSFFFRDPPISAELTNGSVSIPFSFDRNSTPFYPAADTTSTPLTNSVGNDNGDTYFYWSDVNIEGGGESLYTFTNPLTVNASAFNLNDNGINSRFNFMDVAGRNLFFDSASVDLCAATKNSNLIPGYGLRVESGTGLYPNWNQTSATSTSNFGFPYIDTRVLTGSYSNELQIVNGAYVGTNVNCNYSAAVLYIPPGESYSYPNYSGVYTTGGMRYATFMWYIPTLPGIDIQYSVVQFNINDNNFLTSTTNVDITEYIGGVTLQYLLIGLEGANIWPPSATNTSTAWLNGNAAAETIKGNQQRTTNNTPGADTERINSEIRRSVSLAFGNATGTPPFLFFVRVGIPTASIFKFNNIELISLL